MKTLIKTLLACLLHRTPQAAHVSTPATAYPETEWTHDDDLRVMRSDIMDEGILDARMDPAFDAARYVDTVIAINGIYCTPHNPDGWKVYDSAHDAALAVLHIADIDDISDDTAACLLHRAYLRGSIDCFVFRGRFYARTL